MPRFVCALLLVCCATVRAATGFPEFAGFFTETTPGVYQSRGARPAVLAGPGGVRFGGLHLQHLGGVLPRPVGVEPTGGFVHTYSGSRSTTGRAAYRAIEYRELYPGITLRLSMEGRAVKADYIVAAGADPTLVRFRYKGAAASLDGEDLVAGRLRQPAPAVFQGKNRLPAHYEIDSAGWVRFAIAPHDPAVPLVIDPYVITGSAYLGGAMVDQIGAMTMDMWGYIYVAGWTESSDFPAGSLRTRVDGVEAFVLKINPANLQVLYATYLGGTSEDRALAIAVDPSGSAYIAGFTTSTDFPAQPGYAGGSKDAFVARLTASGTLQFATLIGGSGTDSANAITLRIDGHAWVAGETESTNMPLYANAYQNVNRGGQDAFLARVQPDGQIAFTSYFGGSGADRATGVALDSAGEVYFTGGTTSVNFPVASALQTMNAGLQDAFIAKLSADGSALRYSTYLGGSGGAVGQGGEIGNWIRADASGAALVVGTTGSTNFPMAGAPVQGTFGGGLTDAFIARINPSGTALLYSSYFGGASTDEGRTAAVASDGALYFGGNTASPDLIAMDAIQASIGGDIDGYFVKLSSDLSTLLTFTYIGHTGADSLSGLAVTSNSVYLAGSSSSPAWLPSGNFKGWYDGWVMTLNESALSIQMTSTPSGIPFAVSGTDCSPVSTTTPATLSWRSGASCTVSFSSTQGSGDTQNVFQSWADGGTANPRTIVASAGMLSYQMQFSTEHRLTRTVSPAEAGSVSGSDAYYMAGSSVQLTAAANAGYQFSNWSGGATGTANPLAVTMNGPKTVTANYNLLTTINSAAPAQLTVSGTGCAPGAYTAPVTLAWSAGSSCTISFASTQTSSGARWVFSRWSDGSTANSRTFGAAPGAVYTLEWNLEYQLTRTVAPAATGSVSGSDGFYPASSTVQLTATAVTGYQFSSWSGGGTGTANPLVVVMNGPKTIQANFAVRTTQITIDSNVASPQFSVSGAGCNPGAYVAPAVFNWSEGISCSISTQATQGGDVRWIFEGWADGGAANPRTIAATPPSTTYTLRFGTQYKVTRTVNGQGSVSGVDGFHAAGATVQLTATPAGGSHFTGWSGSIVSAANPLVFPVNAASTVTANFSAAPASVSINGNVAAPFTVAGSGCPSGTYSAPTSVAWTIGGTCAITPVSPHGGPDTRWVFANWTDGSTASPRNIVANPGGIYAMSFTPEHKLTRTFSGQGSVSGADGFHAAGSNVQLTASPAPGYQFTGWSGSASGSANPLVLTMDSPKSITANFSNASTGVRFETNIGVQFHVSGAGCPTGTYTAPATVPWVIGASCNVSVGASTLPGGPDTRWVFSRWADGWAINPRSIVASPGAVYTIVLAAEHRLSRTVSGSGSVSGIDGFYAAGSSIQLTASPGAGYHFAGWSGSAGGLTNPLTVIMDGPKSITAVFAASAATVRIEANTPAQFTVSGAGCPAGTYSTPANLTWVNGLVCSIGAVSPHGGPDSRWVFSGWTDGSIANPRGIAASAGAVYTLMFTAEHRLTRNVSGGGSVSGTDGFYATGSTVQLTASPAGGYQFGGWSGSAAGLANPLGLTMDGPKSVTASFTPRPLPSVETLTPSNGSGVSGTFTGTFTHAGGINELYLGYILFLPTPNIVWYTAKGSCLVEYNRISHGMRLIDDPGTGWLGPLEGVRLSPYAGTLTNSQCTVNLSGARVSFTASSMSVTIPVTFKNGLTRTVATFLQASDLKDNWTGMTQIGNWTPTHYTPKPGTAVAGVTSSTTAGSSAVYSIASSHSSGPGQLGMVNLLVSSEIVGTPGCHAVYFPGDNTLNLVNDDGSGLVAPVGVAAGTPGTIANSRCSINTGLAARISWGNFVSISIPLNFQTSVFSGLKNVYANTFDISGQLTHWVQVSTITIQ